MDSDQDSGTPQQASIDDDDAEEMVRQNSFNNKFGIVHNKNRAISDVNEITKDSGSML